MVGFLSHSEKAAAGSPAPSVPPPTSAPAVILGGNEDTRLLLRGLLGLHRHRVLLESQNPEAIARLPVSPETKVLIVDAGTDGATPWAEPLTSILRSRPDLRALVILPRPDPALENRARQAGARRIMVRPFAIRDFVEAVDSVASETGPS